MPSLQFKGKAFVQNQHLVVPFHELTPVKARGTSKTASLHDSSRFKSTRRSMSEAPEFFNHGSHG